MYHGWGGHLTRVLLCLPFFNFLCFLLFVIGFCYQLCTYFHDFLERNIIFCDIVYDSVRIIFVPKMAYYGDTCVFCDKKLIEDITQTLTQKGVNTIRKVCSRLKINTVRLDVGQLIHFSCRNHS